MVERWRRISRNPWAFRYVAPQRLLGRGSLLLRWLGNLVPRCPAKTGGSGSTSLRSERRKSPGVSGRGPATWSAAGRLAPTEAREGTRLHSQACGVCRGRWRRSRGADSGGGGGVAATRRVYVVRRLATCSLSPLSRLGGERSATADLAGTCAWRSALFAWSTLSRQRRRGHGAAASRARGIVQPCADCGRETSSSSSPAIVYLH